MIWSVQKRLFIPVQRPLKQTSKVSRKTEISGLKFHNVHTIYSLQHVRLSVHLTYSTPSSPSQNPRHQKRDFAAHPKIRVNVIHVGN